jgi:hypothetical protein
MPTLNVSSAYRCIDSVAAGNYLVLHFFVHVSLVFISRKLTDTYLLGYESILPDADSN